MTMPCSHDFKPMEDPPLHLRGPAPTAPLCCRKCGALDPDTVSATMARIAGPPLEDLAPDGCAKIILKRKEANTEAVRAAARARLTEEAGRVVSIPEEHPSRPLFHRPETRRPTFDQLWLRLGKPEEDSGMVLISEIALVLRSANWTPYGVVITLKSGKEIEAPDARIEDVRLAIMAGTL